MSSSLLIALEMAGVLGVVLLLGGWELWTLRRDKAQERTEKPSLKVKTPNANASDMDTSGNEKSPDATGH